MDNLKCLSAHVCDNLNKEDAIASVDLIDACETLCQKLSKLLKIAKKFKEELKLANLEKKELVVESFVRSRGVYLHTHTQGYQDQDLSQELDDLFSCCIKNFKEDLKPLSGVSKSQVGELVVAMDQRKMQSMDLELSRGHGSKISTRGSSRMLVV